MQADAPGAFWVRRALSVCTRAAFAALSVGAAACDAAADPSYMGEPLLRVQGSVTLAREGTVTQAPRPLALDVGVLWLASESNDLSEAVDCRLAPSERPATPCAAACGEPDCGSLRAITAWDECSSACGDDSTGLSLLSIEMRFDRLFSRAVGQTTRLDVPAVLQFQLDLVEPPPTEVLIASRSGERAAIGVLAALDPSGSPFELGFGEPRLPPWLFGGSGTHLVIFTPNGIPRESEWGAVLQQPLAPGFHLAELRAMEDEVDMDGEDASFLSLVNPSDARVELTVGDPATIEWPLAALHDTAGDG